MRRKRKGTRIEHKARKVLEAAGYTVVRAGGSLGLYDLIARSPQGWRLVQVKGGKNPYCSPAEREGIALDVVPPGTTKELWLWRDRAPQPDIEVL